MLIRERILHLLNPFVRGIVIVYTYVRTGMHEKTLQTRSVFKGKLLNVEVLDVELEDGQKSTREIMRHPGAAVVVAQRDDDRYVLVRQFRKPLEMDVLEVVAGTLDPGEDPTSCAHRELLEETGYTASSMTPLGKVYPAPGYTDECLHVYYAKLNPGVGSQNPDHDESLVVELLSGEELESLIAAGSICDAKTLSAWLLYKARMPIA